MIINDYPNLPGLDQIYLEDSYVLDIVEQADRVIFIVDAVLTPSSPKYHQPLPGEHYSYAKGRLIFESVVYTNWIKRDIKPYTDANGTVDFGNIDTLSFQGDHYYVEGDWGAVEIFSGRPPRFEYASM